MKGIKKIFENRNQILEGIKNKIFKKEHVETIAKSRWQICIRCDSLDVVGDKCMVIGTQPCCSECGCSLGFKLRSLSSACPLEKWTAMLTEDEEDELNKNIEDE
mgnify:CR=1 FL=1|tara:strand:- start:338 stop:649 length:312 start_codon:yes stop_codon:yes gene_type:complete